MDTRTSLLIAFVGCTRTSYFLMSCTAHSVDRGMAGPGLAGPREAGAASLPSQDTWTPVV